MNSHSVQSSHGFHDRKAGLTSPKPSNPCSTVQRSVDRLTQMLVMLVDSWQLGEIKSSIPFPFSHCYRTLQKIQESSSPRVNTESALLFIVTRLFFPPGFHKSLPVWRPHPTMPAKSAVSLARLMSRMPPSNESPVLASRNLIPTGFEQTSMLR